MNRNPTSLLLLHLISLSFFLSILALENDPHLIPPSTPSSSSYWIKIKAVTNQALSYLFPPNLDFRGSNDEAGGSNQEAGSGEKVKEAVAKSLGKGKATLEDSAKSAAHLAKQKLHKLKNTLSSQKQPHPQPHHEPAEL